MGRVICNVSSREARAVPTMIGRSFNAPVAADWEPAACRVFLEEASVPDVKTVELNASPHAGPFYRRVGVPPISAEFVRGGCRATRMACWLPARELGAVI